MLGSADGFCRCDASSSCKQGIAQCYSHHRPSRFCNLPSCGKEAIPRSADRSALARRFSWLSFSDVGQVAVICSGTLLIPKSILTMVAKLKTAHSPKIGRSEEHTSELQSRGHLVCRLLLEKKTASLTFLKCCPARLRSVSARL